jgi:hypothetical protein
MSEDSLYAIARVVTDEAFGPGSYADHNGPNHPDPQVREQVQISRQHRDQQKGWLSHMTEQLKYEPDLVLKGMAAELREALLANGQDPSDPPNHSKPPVEKAWGEYLRRGGDRYTDPNEFLDDLIRRVGEPQ